MQEFEKGVNNNGEEMDKSKVACFYGSRCSIASAACHFVVRQVAREFVFQKVDRRVRSNASFMTFIFPKVAQRHNGNKMQ